MTLATGKAIDILIRWLLVGEASVWTADETRLIGCTDGAWDSLGWIIPNPRLDTSRGCPAETFGPLPSIIQSASVKQGVGVNEWSLNVT